MANTFAPFGFSQISGLGSSPTYEQIAGFCASTTGAMYFGDPVTRATADGSIIPVASLSPVTSILSGVFVGCKYLSVAQKKTVWGNYWPGSDVATGNLVEVYYINDPNARFLVQVGGSATTTGITGAFIGFNCQFLYGTPNTSSGLSGAYIDQTQTPTTTATWPFKIVSTYTSGAPGSNGTSVGAFNFLIVGFNNVETKTLTGQ